MARSKTCKRSCRRARTDAGRAQSGLASRGRADLCSASSLRCPRASLPSFPNSVWERTFAKLCFAAGLKAGAHGDTKTTVQVVASLRAEAKQSFAKRRSQTEFGNEVTRYEGNEDLREK